MKKLNKMEHQVINNNKPHPFWYWLLAIVILSVISIYTVKASTDSTYVVQGVLIDTELMHSYCEGYKSGYEDGFCYDIYGCIPPITPVCPVRRVNEDNTYKAGYNRGFIEGRKKQQNN